MTPPRAFAAGFFTANPANETVFFNPDIPQREHAAGPITAHSETGLDLPAIFSNDTMPFNPDIP